MLAYRHPVARLTLAGAAAFVLGLPAAPVAEAHGFGRRSGYFIGGVVVGSALVGPRYWGPPPYYPPRVVYVPPPVVYAPPVVYPPVPQVIYTIPAAPAQVQIPAMPMVTAPGIPPAPSAAAPQAMSIEDRLRRLQSLCDQGLLTFMECERRREQILAEL
ncbi:MAG: hypothetical protein JNM79_16720 [Burkholderiales bacterium]|nr:hypothetical protein [Burkholderiales bacterium]